MSYLGRIISRSFPLCIGMWALAVAGPQISLEKDEFDAGIIKEGKASTIMHEFKVKNTGDSNLVIHDVRPG